MCVSFGQGIAERDRDGERETYDNIKQRKLPRHRVVVVHEVVDEVAINAEHDASADELKQAHDQERRARELRFRDCRFAGEALEPLDGRLHAV